MANLTNHQLWGSLSFKTISYSKNYDLLTNDDNFITEHEGIIYELRHHESKPPYIAGEYGFSILNLSLAREFEIDLLPLIKEYTQMDSYDELYYDVKAGKIDLNSIDKIILIHRFILHPHYKKKGVFGEYVEFMYRNHFHGENNSMYILVKPIQTNSIDWDTYSNDRDVKVRHQSCNNGTYEHVPAYKYFDLENIAKSTDIESVEYKLFSVASKCGFIRIDDSNLFEFTPHEIFSRIDSKITQSKKSAY